MWVVWNTSTGYSDESMRFATQVEAQNWIDQHYDEDFGSLHAMRYER